MIIFCTGVSGSNRDDYLKSMVEYAKTKGKDIAFFSVGDLMKKFTKDAGNNYNWDLILNVPLNERGLALNGAIEYILEELPKHEHAIISTHMQFYWKGALSLSGNHKHISKIKPDMFITIIDSSIRIRERLSKRKQWQGTRSLSQDEILLWQNSELNVTETCAYLLSKKHYVIASEEPPENLYKLMFEPHVKKVYVSFPITHASKEARERIRKFVERLRKHFIVFDPASIEIGKIATEIMEGQTLERDIEQFIKKNSDMVIAFFPAKIASWGVVTEVVKASEYTKDTILIAPEGVFQGPFERKKAEKRFFTEEEFFESLKRQEKNRKPIEQERC